MVATKYNQPIVDGLYFVMPGIVHPDDRNVYMDDLEYMEAMEEYHAMCDDRDEYLRTHPSATYYDYVPLENYCKKIFRGVH